MWSVELVVMLAMIAVNSVLAGYEIALASASLARLQRLVDENRPGAAAALYMKQNIEASLAVVQLGITLVAAIAAAVGGAGAGEVLAPVLVSNLGVSAGVAEVLAIALVVAPLTVVTIIFGELIPKVFALRNAEWVCLNVSAFMRWFTFAVWPAVWLFETVVTAIMSWGEQRLGSPGTTGLEAAGLQELRASAALARAARLIGKRQEGIILGAAELGTRPVREIALPAEHIYTLNANASLSDNLIAAHLDMHTRFPVVERPGDPQSIIGYVNVKDLLASLRMNPQGGSIRALVRPLLSLDENQAIGECLERLMREHIHIALVRDAGGAVLGMITLEDIIEELVGDIEDEYDRLPNHVAVAGPGWIVGGGVTLGRLAEVTGIDLTGDATPRSASTLGEWLIGHLGREGRGGDVVERSGMRFVVRKIRRHKPQEVYISKSNQLAGKEPMS